jgi:4-hydroxybenzoate polyprenyltransferase
LLNLLSMDVAVGSVCCALWFARLSQVEPRPQALIALGLTVWIIYTADHLLDARRTTGPASTERHRFHQQHFRMLVKVLVVVLVVDLACVFFIRKAVLQWGLILSGFMVVYFLANRYLKYLKELTIAILFSCGVLLPSLALSHKPVGLSLALIIGQFMLTALLNLILFSWFDRHHDKRDNRDSFVTLAGERESKRFLSIVFLLNVMLLIGSVFYVPTMIREVAILLLMNAVLILMFVRSSYFESNDRFRLVGDAIFLLPLIYVWL